jgi:hypothetical protein
MKNLLPLFISVLFFAVTAPAADAPKWIELPGGLTYALVEQEDLVSTRIPINPLPGGPPAPATLKASLRDVVFAEARPAPLAGAIKLKLEPGTTELGPALIVTAPASDLLPGNYLVMVDFLYEGGPPETARAQSVTFTLPRAAPQLTSLRSVNVWQERSFRESERTAGRLQLKEESRKAAVRGLSFTEVRAPVAGQPNETGRLLITPGTSTIAPGSDLELKVLPEGDFPLGETSGKIQVHAPNLAAPLMIDYKVTSVRTSLWIAILAILGALMGWLVRKFFQLKRERANSRIAASEVLGALIAARKSVPDAAFVKAIQDAETALQAGARNKKPATIDAAVGVARAALTAAQNELAPRRTTLVAALTALRATLKQLWRLPPAVGQRLDDARVLADSVLALANAQDIGQAQKTLDDKGNTVRTALFNAAVAWRVAAAKYLDKIAQHPPPLPAQGATRLNEAVAAWKKQFEKADDLTSVSSEELQAELVRIHSAYSQARSIAGEMRAGAMEVSTWARSLFVPPGDPAPFDALDKSAETQADALDADLAEPGAASPNPAKRELEARTVWEEALLSAIPNANPSTVKAALDKSEWTAAAEAARKLVVPRSSGAGTALTFGGGTGSAPPVTVLAPLARGISLYSDPVTASAVGLTEVTPGLTGEVIEREMLSRAEEKAAFWQSILLSVIFIALAYAFYGGAWVGTLREMLGVFAWAFGLDLTADALSPLIKKVGTPANT